MAKESTLSYHTKAKEEGSFSTCFLSERRCTHCIRKYTLKIRKERQLRRMLLASCFQMIMFTHRKHYIAFAAAPICYRFLMCYEIRYNSREMAAGQDSVLGEDISVLIITFTSDWLTVPQIKKVHLASINYIYLRLSLHEISALAKKD